MSAESNKAVNPDESQNSKQTVDQSRRSFAKTGALVAPVILSFVSRPSWGQDVPGKCTPSIANSAFHQSHHPSEGGVGCTPNSPSTVSPGVFQGDGGGLLLSTSSSLLSTSGGKWEEYGVGDYREWLFNSVFTNGPGVTIDHKENGDHHKENKDPTLEEVIKAKANDLKGADNAHVNHYITAFLSAMSPVLVFPYTASQITSDWGVWQLFPILQELQDTHLTVAQAMEVIKKYS